MSRVLRDFEVMPWYAFFLPRDTPLPIVQKLNAAVAETIETPALQAKLKAFGYTFVTPDRRSPEYLRAFVDAEIERWGAVIKAAGVAGQ